MVGKHAGKPGDHKQSPREKDGKWTKPIKGNGKGGDKGGKGGGKGGKGK